MLNFWPWVIQNERYLLVILVVFSLDTRTLQTSNRKDLNTLARLERAHHKLQAVTVRDWTDDISRHMLRNQAKYLLLCMNQNIWKWRKYLVWYCIYMNPEELYDTGIYGCMVFLWILRRMLSLIWLKFSNLIEVLPRSLKYSLKYCLYNFTLPAHLAFYRKQSTLANWEKIGFECYRIVIKLFLNISCKILHSICFIFKSRACCVWLLSAEFVHVLLIILFYVSFEHVMQITSPLYC